MSSKMQNVQITAGGKIKSISPKGSRYTVAELSKLVGGAIEVYATSDGKSMIVMNDNGNPHQLPVNKVASDFFNANTRFMNTSVIKGDVAIIDAKDYDPNTLANQMQQLFEQFFGKNLHIANVGRGIKLSSKRG